MSQVTLISGSKLNRSQREKPDLSGNQRRPSTEGYLKRQGKRKISKNGLGSEHGRNLTAHDL